MSFPMKRVMVCPGSVTSLCDLLQESRHTRKNRILNSCERDNVELHSDLYMPAICEYLTTGRIREEEEERRKRRRLKSLPCQHTGCGSCLGRLMKSVPTVMSSCSSMCFHVTLSLILFYSGIAHLTIHFDPRTYLAVRRSSGLKDSIIFSIAERASCSSDPVRGMPEPSLGCCTLSSNRSFHDRYKPRPIGSPFSVILECRASQLIHHSCGRIPRASACSHVISSCIAFRFEPGLGRSNDQGSMRSRSGLTKRYKGLAKICKQYFGFCKRYVLTCFYQPYRAMPCVGTFGGSGPPSNSTTGSNSG